MITQEEVKNLFRYDNGILYWIKHPHPRIDIEKPAGYKRYDGYVQIGINGKIYKRPRLIFLMENGYFPKEIDHINRIKDDDRIINLRECTHSENMKNRPLINNKITKHKFINSNIITYKNKKYQYYRFTVTKNGKRIHIKSSKNLEKLVAFRDQWIHKYRPDLYLY